MIEDRFIFFPDRQVLANPGNLALEFEDVYFRAADGVLLHGWFVPGEGKLTWLWFHGNAGNVSHRLDNLAILHRRLGVDIFIPDYRGYGRSEGQPSEKGTYSDALGALDYLLSQRQADPARIVYFGRSLGAAVAVDLATRRSPGGLVLESPFTSLRDMAKVASPHLPLFLLVRSGYDSLAKIGRVRCPLMVLHGDRDEVVPINQGRRLYQAAQDPKCFYEIPGASHNDTTSWVESPITGLSGTSWTP